MRCRFLILLAGLAVAVLQAHAQSGPCPATPVATAAHTATCNGKSTCGVDDLVELKAAGSAGPLGNVYICVGEGSKRALLVELGDLNQSAYSFALGRRVDALIGSGESRDAPVLQLLHEVHTGGLPVQIVFQGKDQAPSVRMLELDIAKFWSSGRLKPRIDSAGCLIDKEICRFGDTLRLRMEHAGAWTAYAKPDLSKLTLVIDGVRMSGLAAAPSLLGTGLDFRLTRDPTKAEQAAAWANVLARVPPGGGGLPIGLADDKGAIASVDTKSAVVRFGNQSRFAWSLSILTAALLGWLFLTGTADWHHWRWLRDASPIPQDIAISERMTFSLGRCQMFLWTAVIVVSFLYILATTGDGNSFNGTAFALMGISAATALGSIAATSYSKVAQAEIDAYKGLTAPSVAQQQHLLGYIGSKNWWLDLTSEDAQRTGLHRLQNIAFTLLLVVVFLTLVLTERTMPTLSETQLALIGISSAGYIGFKAAEK
jgi:hypothetical protein